MEPALIGWNVGGCSMAHTTPKKPNKSGWNHPQRVWGWQATPCRPHGPCRWSGHPQLAGPPPNEGILEKARVNLRVIWGHLPLKNHLTSMWAFFRQRTWNLLTNEWHWQFQKLCGGGTLEAKSKKRSNFGGVKWIFPIFLSNKCYPTTHKVNCFRMKELAMAA